MGKLIIILQRQDFGVIKVLAFGHCYFADLVMFLFYVSDTIFPISLCRRNISGQEFGGMYCIVLTLK